MAVDYYWQDRNTLINSWDVSDPQSPTEAWSLELEGSLLTSRRIDDILYLVTRHTPSVAGLLPYPLRARWTAAGARTDHGRRCSKSRSTRRTSWIC